MNKTLLDKYRYRTALIFACRHFGENEKAGDMLEEHYLKMADDLLEQVPYHVIEAVESLENRINTGTMKL